MPSPDRCVAFVIHDVSPSTWRECALLINLLDDLQARPLTLLVIPFRHGRSPVAHAPRFVAAMEERLARGDELVLHGYYHQDSAPPPRSVRGLIERRLLTRGEGEFAAIDSIDAARRLERGIAMFDRLGWPLYGFVPPAWLLGADARRALDLFEPRFRYVSSRRFVYRLPQWTPVDTANLCYSPDRAWRRMLSRVLIKRELARSRQLGLLRLSMHPQDVYHPAALAHWRILAESALHARKPVTKWEWVVRETLRETIRKASASARRIAPASLDATTMRGTPVRR